MITNVELNIKKNEKKKKSESSLKYFILITLIIKPRLVSDNLKLFRDGIKNKNKTTSLIFKLLKNLRNMLPN